MTHNMGKYLGSELEGVEYGKEVKSEVFLSSSLNILVSVKNTHRPC